MRMVVEASSVFYLLFLLMLFGMPFAGSSSLGGGTGAAVAPIKHLEASVAASSAHTSVAAVHCSFQQGERECVVLVSFRPLTEASQEPRQPPFDDIPLSKRRAPQQRKFGLSLSTTPPQDIRRWTRMGESTICVMTGFVPDVQHLTKVTLNYIESHRMIYSTSMSVDRIVRYLASSVQRAARMEGGRPYGIQALLVGIDSRQEQQRQQGRCFHLYTVDPAGGWQHFSGGATAIGRGAQDVRARLYKELQNNTLNATDENATASEALKIAISSLLGKQAVEKSSGDEQQDYANQLEALLLWRSESGSYRVSRIDDSEIQTCLKCIAEKQA